jgi:hypothetical protein
MQRPGPPGCGFDSRLTNFLCKKKYCYEIQRIENRRKSGRIFQGRLGLKKGSSANYDDDGKYIMMGPHI